MHLRRTRAERLAHVQHTNRPYHVPEMGQKSASQAKRAGGAERFPAPAVQKRIAVDWALIEYYDRLLSNREVSIVKTARHHEANPLSRLQTVPGVGTILRLGLLYAIHASQRCPRGQACVSSCRRVKCAQEAAGQRDGPAGTKIGTA
jgi:hypothetical protein